MSHNEIEIDAPVERVFDELTDPRTYPDWLVGAKRIRSVDGGWPRAGTAFHHTVGIGPFTVSDRTTVLDVHRPNRLHLDTGVGPFGAARVTFTVEAVSASRTRVTIEELPHRGLVKIAWRFAGKGLMQLGLLGRNEVSLRQLRSSLEDSSITS